MGAAVRCFGWLALAIVVAWAAMGGAPIARAQTAPAVQSDPTRDAILTAPPRRIDLSFMDLVDPAGPATIRLVADDGRVIPLGQVRLDPNDPRRLAAAIPDALPSGTYTVLWSAAFAPPVAGSAATPGPGGAASAVRTGSFAFRVAPPPAAGGAAPDATWPTAWGAAARWLVWAGIALAAAGALFGLLRGAGAADAESAMRRIALVAIGGTVALLATLAQPLLLKLTAGAAGPVTLGEAFGLMGVGWWTTLAATALLALVGLGTLASGVAVRPAPRPLDLIPLALTLAAAAGLALTARLGAAPQGDPLGLASSLVHDWSSLLVLAAVGAALLARSAGGGSGLAWAWLGRLALAAGLIAFVTGVLEAGLALPSLALLGGSAWGAALLAKGLLALGLVAFAALGWILARRKAGTGPFAIAAGLGALALLASSTLALMAAPGAPASPLAQVALAVPLPSAASGAAPTLLHLTVQPALPGRNAATTWVTDAAGALPADLPTIDLRFSPLDHAAPTATLAPALDPNDGAGAGAVDLPGAGWWAVTATVTPRDGPAMQTTFYLILPDPNVTGAGPLPPDDPHAKAVFARGLAGMTSLKNVRFAQTLGDGGGSVYTSESVVTTDPPAFEERSANATVIVADGQQWIKAGDAPWSISPAAAVPLPSTWGDAYTPVAGFRLGPVETIDGEPCQVVTFYHLNEVGRQWAPTWYAWWVGTESGRVRREAMVSTRHYMIYNYSAFDEPATIAPPADAPGATPGP